MRFVILNYVCLLLYVNFGGDVILTLLDCSDITLVTSYRRELYENPHILRSYLQKLEILINSHLILAPVLKYSEKIIYIHIPIH